MATHEENRGLSDQELLARMVGRYDSRYDAEYWRFFEAHVGCHLPARPTIVDLGCGPGLYLRDLSERHRDAILHGFDISPVMIEHARGLRYPGATPTLVLHDLTKDPLPSVAHSVDLVCMTAVLHRIEDPFAVLAEIARILRPGGIFLNDDWIRIPLHDYLESRRTGPDELSDADRRRWMRVFPLHCKYTADDWKWLLAEAGFSLRTTAQFRPHSQIFVAEPRD